MSTWDRYPENYREKEVRQILAAVRAGESVQVIGLSGAGKSNLSGFIANRKSAEMPFVVVDCNRLVNASAEDLFSLIASACGLENSSLAGLEKGLAERLAAPPGSLCLIFDRFEVVQSGEHVGILANLRSLRDAFKYRLTYLLATRALLDPHSELAELFFANTIWLGPLSDDDALWSANSYAERRSLAWEPVTLEKIVQISGRYPSLLRAVCEAHAAGTELEVQALFHHPAVQRRREEFWEASPDADSLRLSGLETSLLLGNPACNQVDGANLTAKEALLLKALQESAGQICNKDDLIRAVWSEDRIYQEGMRDDSLAQLVRRLRVKIEVDANHPQLVQTVPGRGYRYSG